MYSHLTSNAVIVASDLICFVGKLCEISNIFTISSIVDDENKVIYVSF